MARILLQGAKHTAEITIDDEDGQVIVQCLGAPEGAEVAIPCEEYWIGKFDTLDDATEYAAHHVDGKG